MIDINKPILVLIAVPSGSHWLADFASNLIMAIVHFINTPLFGRKDHICQVANIKGSLLPNSRLEALNMAKKVKATHLLYLDTDHTFPPDLIHQLLMPNKDVIAANCVTKSIPSNTTARLYNAEDPRGTIVYSDEGAEPNLQQVWRVGTGVMMLSKKAFGQLNHDCFAVEYKADRDSYQGEDWTLCERLEKAGVPIYVDHALSRQIGHLGILDYGHDMVGTVVRESTNVA